MCNKQRRPTNVACNQSVESTLEYYTLEMLGSQELSSLAYYLT